MKVDSIISHLQQESPNSSISVSKVCRLAKINRANLYQTYPDLVRKILATNQDTSHKKRTKKRNERDKDAEIANLKMQVNAHIYAALELQLALEIANRKIATLEKKIKK